MGRLPSLTLGRTERTLMRALSDQLARGGIVTHMNVTEARDNFSDVINRVAYGHERVCLSRGGKDVACVVSVEEAQILDLLEDRLDLHDALAALEEAKTEGTIPWSDFKRELGL
jgi:prevent-host-death family protein